MTGDQVIVIAVLMGATGMFLWGRWRHDMVAMGALLACVVTGLIPGASAFSGFGHPAVVTVACVLVLGYGLQISGAVDILAKRLLPATAGPTLSILALITLAAVLSSFMNNVGALALLMPVAIQMAAKLNLPSGKILMPLAFGSILGGMTTLIGTPPNLIVSGFRANGFGMFDFAPVGVSVAAVGILFVGLIGWRWVPARKQSSAGGFESGTYFSEVRIVQDSKAVNKTLREVERMLDAADAQIVGMVRRDVRISAPNPRRVLRAGDVLVIEVDPESLATALSSLGLALEGAVHLSDDVKANKAQEAGTEPLVPASPVVADNAHAESVDDKKTDKSRADEVTIVELVVKPNAELVGRSAAEIELRTQHGINLLALSRQGRQTIRRLRSARIQAGDVLLMQGAPEAVSGFAAQFGCLPLATRDIRVPQKGHALKASVIMLLAVMLAATGLLPVAVSFAAGALFLIVVGVIPLRSVYSAVDWPVIVLLGAMLPVANAMATTGAADVLARFLLDTLAQGHAVVVLVVILVATMMLTDFMNNAATAAVMCPIGLSAANQLGGNPDTFLMAISVGASCAFLTPIGHQNNTLILGPGGFRFGDYWRMGLPMDVLVVAVSVPMLLYVWPL